MSTRDEQWVDVSTAKSWRRMQFWIPARPQCILPNRTLRSKVSSGIPMGVAAVPRGLPHDLENVLKPEITLEDLKRHATAASRNAYCPYSKFPVGAAVLTDRGEIFSGCNVENAAFGLTICAERNAIFQAVANGAKRLRSLVIYTPTATPTTPCGSCRQVLNEFGSDAEIICCCDGARSVRYTLPDLLPEAFGPENLR